MFTGKARAWRYRNKCELGKLNCFLSWSKEAKLLSINSWSIVTKPCEFQILKAPSSQVKSSHLYLYSAFNNTNCDKATAQYQNGKIVSIM